MNDIYSYQNNVLHIHSQYKELWKLIRYEGKFIPTPKQNLTKNLPKTQRLTGKIMENGVCYFNNIGFEIKLDYNYDYKIQWKSNKNIKIGFYSPCRVLGNNLYLNVDQNNNLTKYKGQKGETIINCHRLVVFLSDFYRKCSHYPDGRYNNDEIIIKLKITPLPVNDCSKLKIFHVKQEGLFQRHILKLKYQKVVQLIREYYEKTSINRNLYLTPKIGILPAITDYDNVLAKSDYQSIFSVTTQIKPITDRDGYYGIVIKRDPKIISSATITYNISLSDNILTTPDIIVIAAYYDGKNYVVHRVNNVEVINTHTGPFPYESLNAIHKSDSLEVNYPNDKNIIKGKLLLESSATDITLIITNSLYGLLPIDGQDPDTIIQFNRLEVSYDSVER